VGEMVVGEIRDVRFKKNFKNKEITITVTRKKTETKKKP